MGDLIKDQKHNSEKMRFLESVEMKQGDGLGPKYEAGKVYWLGPDQAAKWRAHGVAVDEADEADEADNLPAENLPRLWLYAENVKVVRIEPGGEEYNVIGPNETIYNSAPLSAHEAEGFRKYVLDTGELPPMPEHPDEAELEAEREDEGAAEQAELEAEPARSWER